MYNDVKLHILNYITAMLGKNLKELQLFFMIDSGLKVWRQEHSSSGKAQNTKLWGRTK